MKLKDGIVGQPISGTAPISFYNCTNPFTTIYVVHILTAWLDAWSGRRVWTVLDGTRKRISLPDIRDTSALQVSPFHRIGLYESIFTY